LKIKGKSEQNVIRRICNGVVSTVAADSNETLNSPFGIAVDGTSNIFVADTNNHVIRKITNGVMSTWAGTVKGNKDGPCKKATFYCPASIAVTTNGEIYVADYWNHSIRKVTRNAEVVTIAGNGECGYTDGECKIAKFNKPCSLVVDTENTLYIADCFNDRIRKITTNGQVSTISDKIRRPTGLAMFNNELIIAEFGKHRVVIMNLSGELIFAMGTGIPGFKDGDSTQAQFNFPWGVAVDKEGNIFVADRDNHRIRKIEMDLTPQVDESLRNLLSGLVSEKKNN